MRYGLDEAQVGIKIARRNINNLRYADDTTLMESLYTQPIPPAPAPRTKTSVSICFIQKVREFQQNTYFCFIDYAKAFDCVNHNKLWKILKEMGIPDHLTCI